MTTRTSKSTTAKQGTPKPKAPRDTNQYANPPKTLDEHYFYRIRVDEEQRKFRQAIWDKNIQIVFCDARAGTGKTTIAVATANLLVKYGLYEGITYIISPCMEGELGFLPGSAEEKTKPYATALQQALLECDEQPERVIIQNGCASVKDGAYVDFIPHTFLRGTNLKNRVVILDESQNFDIHSLKKVLTRIHDNSKAIVIGHSGQRDAFRAGDSAFKRYIEHFKPDPRAAVCELSINYRGWLANHADELY